MRNTPILLVLLVSIVLYSCQKNDSNDPKSSDKEIKSVVFKSADNAMLAYDVSGVTGTDSVKCLFPPNTAINNLLPEITFLGKSITPANRSARDFTNPVAYTVTAADGTTKQYILSCSVAADSAGMLLGRWDVIKDSSTNDGFVTSSGVYVNPGVYTGRPEDYWEFNANGILNFHANDLNAFGLKYRVLPNARLYVDVISSAFDDGYFLTLTPNKATFYFTKTNSLGKSYYRRVYLKR